MFWQEFHCNFATSSKMKISIKHIISLVFILLFSLNGIISFCPALTAKLAKIANVEILFFPETNEAQKNAEAEKEPMVKELFFSNHMDYNLQKTHYTVTKKSIADNNFVPKQDVVLSVIIPPPKII